MNYPLNIIILSMVSLLVMMGSTMINPSLTVYAKVGLHASEFFVGAAIAGFAIGRLIFDLPAAHIIDKVGINKAMKLGLVVLVISSICAGLATDIATLFAMRIAEGIGSSLYVAGAVTLILLSSAPSKRGSTMGMYQSIIMIGPIIGPIIGAPIAAFYGLAMPYFAFSASIAVALVLTMTVEHKGRNLLDAIIHDTKKTQNPAHGRDMGLMTDKSKNNAIYAYFTSASLATFGFTFLRSGVYTTAIPLFAYGFLNLSIMDVGLVFTVSSVTNLLSSFVSGRITDKYGMKYPVISSLLAASFVSLLIPFVNISIMLVILAGVLGIASGFFGQTVAWAADQIDQKVVAAQGNTRSNETNKNLKKNPEQPHSVSFMAKGIGFNRLIADSGLIVGPIVVGFVISHMGTNLNAWLTCFAFVSTILILISAILAWINRKNVDTLLTKKVLS
jgi:MFS family permease